MPQLDRDRQDGVEGVQDRKLEEQRQAARHRAERIDVLLPVELHHLLVHLLPELLPRPGVPPLRLLLLEPVVALLQRLHLRLHALHLLLHDTHLNLAAVEEREEQQPEDDRQEDDRPAVVADVALQDLHRVKQRKRHDAEEPEVQESVQADAQPLEDVVVLGTHEQLHLRNAREANRHGQMELLHAVLHEPQQLEADATAPRLGTRRNEHGREVLVLDPGPGDRAFLQPGIARLEGALRTFLRGLEPGAVEHSPRCIGVPAALPSVVRSEARAPDECLLDPLPSRLRRELQPGDVRIVTQAQRLRGRQPLPVAPREGDFRELVPVLLPFAPAHSVQRLPEPLGRLRVVEQELQRKVVERPSGARHQLERMSRIVQVCLELPGGHAGAAVGQADRLERRVDRDLFFGGGLETPAGRHVRKRRRRGAGAADTREAGRRRAGRRRQRGLRRR